MKPYDLHPAGNDPTGTPAQSYSQRSQLQTPSVNPYLSTNPPYPSQVNPPYPSQVNPPYPSQANPPYPSQANQPYPSQANQPYPSQANQMYPPKAISQAKKPARRKGKPRDLIVALLVGTLCFFITDCFLWTGTLGLGFAAGTVLLPAVEIWYIAPVVKRKSAYVLICILGFIAGCVSLVFSADSGMKALTLLCLIALNTILLMESMELRAWEAGSFRAVGDFFYTCFAASFGKIGAGVYALFRHEKRDESKRKTAVGKAFLGLLIALPFVAVLLWLLYNADQAFHGMMDNIDLEQGHEKLVSLLLASPAFVYLFSQLFSLQDVCREPRKESGKGFDPIILTFFLLGISLLYVVYLFSQLAYFFNGFMGFLPENYTYAEYARRGFFELTAVSFINILIVIFSGALCKKWDGRLPLGVKLTSLFLCLFSLVLVFTEVAKMKMYMDAFGLTRLRILTTLFMLFLAVVFFSLILRVFIRKIPYMKVAVVTGALFLIVTNFVSIDGIVASYNVNAYRNGALSAIDMETITELGDAAVPELVRLASDSDAAKGKYDIYYREKAKDELLNRWKMLHAYGEMIYTSKLENYDYRGFNLTSYRARQLLLANENLFVR